MAVSRVSRPRASPSDEAVLPSSIIDSVLAGTRLTALVEDTLKDPSRPLRLGNVWGSSYALMVAALRKRTGRPVLLIAPNQNEAEEACEDLSVFLAARPTLFPETEFSSERLTLAFRRMQRMDTSPVWVASIKAMVQSLPSPARMKEDLVALQHGRSAPRETLVAKLVDHDFENVSLVDAPGQFSVRGGLLDVYPWTATLPLRLDYVNNTVDSIRTFDPNHQGSLDSLDQVGLCLSRPSTGEGESSLLEYLDPSWIVAIKGAIPDDAGRTLSQFSTVTFNPLPEPSAERSHNFSVRSLQRFSGTLANIPRELAALAEEGRNIVFVCKTPGEEERLKEILRDADVSLRPFRWVQGILNYGFLLGETGTAFLPHHELFNRYRLRRSTSFVSARPRASAAKTSWQDLEPGDYVVHQDHGIGQFLTVERAAQPDGTAQEFLVIEYDGGARLHTPTANMDLVQKYLGPTETPPALHRLGGKAWNASKERAWKAVMDLSRELLEIQAMREMKMGTAYPPDADWEREFETSFPYEETDDQTEAARAIREDMGSAKPMDRLLCGDVGYGKTELAMRAAFKVAVHGKQVAVLVPTTILAQQHYQTFRERMADYPVTIEVLSRFRTRAEQHQTLERLAEGKADIVIGTHRLLQPDVVFKDLGLVVIDEEQRFGVEHKEKLKRLRATVDVLTLTATPIPRTLHMSLLGIKDISTLATPPRDRVAIRTEIMHFDPQRLRTVILTEIGRGGQVFFVHNRVMDIHEIADKVRKIAPEARVGIAHGQMAEDELEETMLHFLEREVDVLVATTIIESGLDIPNANTIIINNADHFGLADMHQLRGRVGRYKHQAYAYLIVPEDRPVLPQAQKRLKAIEEFSELGAGFKIAMRDLEIRGVGNLLGREQHGHIIAIGYDMYGKLLKRAVKKMKSEPADELPDVTVDLKLDAYIPGDYVPDLKTRLELYRKLSQCKEMKDLEAAEREWVDRFGAPPPPVRNLLEVQQIKILAAGRRIVSIATSEGALIAKILSSAEAKRLQKKSPDRVRIVDDETIYFLVDGTPAESLARLKNALS